MMNNLAPALSTLLVELYGFHQPKLVPRVDRGYSGENFVISDAETKYFVKKYHSKRTRELIEEIHRAARFFYERNVPAIAPLTNTKGEGVFEYQGRYLAVFPYVNDKELSHLPSDHTAASIGSTLARLHLASKDNPTLVISRPMDRWTKDKFLSKAQELLKQIENTDFLSDFDVMAREFLELKILLAEKGSVRFEELSFKDDAILHGDYHYLNMFFDDQGNVSHLFDFERVRKGDRAAELAYGLFFNCFDMNKTSVDTISEIHFSRARSYLSAYTELYPLSPERIANGIRWYYWSQMVHQLWPLDSHYVEGDTRAGDLVPIRFNRLKYFAANLDSVLGILLK